MRWKASKGPLRWGECRYDGRCLITGGDALQEWMLPWWYGNARRHSRLPVVFADLGLTSRALAWCRERGEVVRSGVRAACPFLAKPLVLMQSPYAESLWTDLDCEILGPVEPVFGETHSEIGVVRDVPGASDPVQAGVLVVRHGSPTVLEWAGLCRDWRTLDRSRIPTRHRDQSLLGYLWRLRPEAFTVLGDGWNRSRIIRDAGRQRAGTIRGTRRSSTGGGSTARRRSAGASPTSLPAIPAGHSRRALSRWSGASGPSSTVVCRAGRPDRLRFPERSAYHGRVMKLPETLSYGAETAYWLMRMTARRAGSPERLRRRQIARLRAVLSHCRDHYPFYRAPSSAPRSAIECIPCPGSIPTRAEN